VIGLREIVEHGLRWQYQAVKVANRAREDIQLGLRCRAHSGKSISCTDVPRIRCKAKSGQASFAIFTESTGRNAETFLELLGARVRNPNTRSAYRVAWRSFLAFCSGRQLDLESVKAYHVGAWLDQHPGSRSTQRQHLAAVRLLFDSLMMRGGASCWLPVDCE
jgi:Phage integrase, N-terminal SAM-like domain